MSTTDKWADFVISEVSYNKEKEYIEKVRVMVDRGDKLSSPEVVLRSIVANNLERGYSYVTTYKNSDGNWKRGDEVGVVSINNTKFIRTDGNRVAKDNLGELPEF